jgi:penicillin amidase
MKKVSKDFVYPLLALILLTIILSYRLFNICPLGKFLNPFIGALQNTHDDDLINSNLEILDLELLDSVNVFYDDRKVPHIFAKNDDDLFFCQGYITASLRLWQMDFITYACAGRLSEIFGDEYVDSDRTQRRRGLLEAATNSLELISMDAKTDSVLTAYTNGVNAYIDQLNYKKLPLEYKVLDYIPEHWTKLKTILILKYMGQVLSGYEEDISMTDLILMLDEKDFNALYPSFNTHVSSITDFNKQFKKENIKQIYKPDYLDNSFLFLNRSAVQENFNPKLGSNNWVVSGKKTKSGHTILCNDPHLSLSLPSIWLEMQLSSPSENVYGVSIPGTPSIIIGFNKDIAWGMTNGAIDVKDWYKLKLSDDYKRYKFDSLWKDLKYRVEEIKIRNRRSVFDTVL